MVQQVLRAIGLVGNDRRRVAGQGRGELGFPHRGHAMTQVGHIEGDEDDRSDARQIARADGITLLPRLEVSTVRHANRPHGQGIGVFGKIDRDHFPTTA